MRFIRGKFSCFEFSSRINTLKEIKKTSLTVTLFCASLIFCIVSNVLTLNVSSVFVILFAAAVGMFTLAAGGKNA